MVRGGYPTTRPNGNAIIPSESGDYRQRLHIATKWGSIDRISESITIDRDAPVNQAVSVSERIRSLRLGGRAVFKATTDGRITRDQVGLHGCAARPTLRCYEDAGWLVRAGGCQKMISRMARAFGSWPVETLRRIALLALFGRPLFAFVFPGAAFGFQQSLGVTGLLRRGDGFGFR